MELRAHHIVVVSGQDADARSRLPVPDADGLIIGCTQHPGILVVKHGRANVVQVTEQREDAALLLVVPDLKRMYHQLKFEEKNFPSNANLNFEVVTTGYEERLLIVKRNSSNGAIVLVVLLE